MKVLHIVQNYHPAIGGAELLTQNISVGLIERGHQITVLTSNAPSSEAYINSKVKTFPPGIETISGVVVKRLPIVQLPTFVRRIFDAIMLAFWQGRLPFNDLIRILWAGPYIKGLRYEIMNSEADLLVATSFPFLHIYQAFSAARKRCSPFVVIPCTHPMDAWAFENPRHYRLLQECQAVITNTSYEKDYLISRGVSGEKIHTVGLGIYPEHFNRAARGEFRGKYSIGDEERIVLFTGRKAEGKGIRLLLRAMKRVWEVHSGVKLVLAGSATEFSRKVIGSEIARFPEGMRRNIINVDDFEESQKDSLYTDCDIFVLPSMVESFGIVFLEAWICGKPVIGCRTGPVVSVITEGQDGLLVRYGNVEELAATIMRLLKDADLRNKLGSKGREKVLERYTWDKIVSKMEAIYQTLIGEQLDGKAVSKRPSRCL
jgi:glycosyltransferase involved in cell wall biosynthesis